MPGRRGGAGGARELPLADHDVAAPGSPGTGLDAVVLTALRRLPARQREVIVLRVFLDLDIETTARQLAIAPGTVRAHLSRAVTALRNELAQANTTEADPCHGNDQMTDGAELRELRDSLSGVAMPERPRLEAITARGRARRRHRLSAVAGLSVAGAAAGTALALGLTGVLGPARTPGTIRTAAFTLVSNSNGTATLTINPKELLDPAALQSDLAQYGIPAKVTTGSFCSSDPAPAGFSQVVSLHSGGAVHRDAAERVTSHHHDRPGGHASGHRAQHRQLPAQLGPVRGRAAGRLRAHRHQLLHLQQHPA